jgi:hypothetical protein
VRDLAVGVGGAGFVAHRIIFVSDVGDRI